MASPHRASMNDKSSIRYWWIPLDVSSSEPDNAFTTVAVNLQSKTHVKNSKQPDTIYSSNRLSTSQLLASVVGIWAFVGQPTVFETKSSLKHSEICPKKNISGYFDNVTKRVTAFGDGEKNTTDLAFSSSSPSSLKSDFQYLKTIKRTFSFASCNMNVSNLNASSDSHSDVDSSRCDKLTNIEVANGLAYIYDSMTIKDRPKLTGNESHDADKSSTIGKSSPPANHFSSRNSESDSTIEDEDCSGDRVVNLVNNLLQPPDSLHATYSVQFPVTSTRETIFISTSPSSDDYPNYDIGVLKSANQNLGRCQQSADSGCDDVENSAEVSTECHNVREKHKSLIHEDVTDEGSSTMYQISMQDKLQLAFSKNKHALAGALAGTLVSLCVHPVDTVKTIIQANGAGHKSSTDILRKIISERGALGLYRGIASNIASSAPISAIYTYTYESVKGALLPILPKEYHSFAHCIAGGCSSIATSLVFTPSERIKQQMQVGLHYQNCWNALIGCIEKGGLPSLYTGWGAVLCRNIPHSIIKFYTYERLKQLFLASSKPNAGLSTLQTLVCGGLAGSTAAFFTTPFDVVKTRLQTQVPGSLAKYNGVFHALQEIAREEGLQGLYRGLTPRLAMYVSQGAIFFASYEFLKAVFSLEAKRPSSRVIDNKENADCAPSRLHKLSS